MKNRIKYIIKNETVLSVAIILAVVSSLFVLPDREYINYIDFRTLSLLFCLMAVMAGFQKSGFFDVAAKKILGRIRGIRGLSYILIMLCFFLSMLVTNDVALITFVPFTFTVFGMAEGEEKDGLIIRTVVMQTVAANLGSMLTPIGNPQNIYLHGLSGMSVAGFMLLMMPYTALSFMLLSLWTVLRCKSSELDVSLDTSARVKDKKRVAIYSTLFLLCLASVGKLIDYRITLLIIAAVIAVSDYRILAEVDYTLLLTFIAFFVFIGNMGRIDAFRTFVSGAVRGRECLTGVLSSQIISNVPAALLLSGFTKDIKPLIVGVDLGGLGTLIGSMASLISFKLVGHENKSLRGRYLSYFTFVNIIFLIFLLVMYYILQQAEQSIFAVSY
ncbi:MAG: citrate transporter [Clostridia bacterium]|nr:citrate transporter [Clostridia bacterium]